ncbi:fungal-specific transcription factor domain-containing protein [Pyrenochaeta sp. MPI-SDFR-AT-0127]|nr:fungal-specific transcription factor domain-containing protein [Pyrenochaeta sp. MPI-SDFR-AT-0127]
MHSVRQKRTTTGCLTCRMRRKKCNDARPTCIGCQRNHLICTWPTDRKAFQEILSSRSTAQKPPKTTDVVIRKPVYGTSAPTMSAATPPAVTRNLVTIPHPLDLMPGIRKQTDKHFFDHYLNVTALQLAGRVSPRNAFLSHLIPLAYQDARVVQCLLALSGAQLCYHSNHYEHNARSHYAVSLRSVKHALLDWHVLKATELAGLLTSTLMLCFFEVVIGNADGNFFFHLRASRTMLLELRGNRAHQVDQSLLDLLTEFYAFFAINANLTLHTDLPVNREIPEDPFLSSESLVSLNKGSDIHGVLFGSAHELFGLIMPIARSARYLLQHQNLAQRDINLRKYEKQIKAWTYVPSSQSSLDRCSDASNPDAYKLAGEVYRQAILIFLYTMFHGPNPPTPSLIAQVDALLDITIYHAAAIPFGAPVQTTMAWAALIGGSCMRNSEHRAILKYSMENVSLSMLSLRRNLSFLEALWEEMDEDELVYGPYGIELTMQRREIHLTCA